jgi:hypothetical protein
LHLTGKLTNFGKEGRREKEKGKGRREKKKNEAVRERKPIHQGIYDDSILVFFSSSCRKRMVEPGIELATTIAEERCLTYWHKWEVSQKIIKKRKKPLATPSR